MLLTAFTPDTLTGCQNLDTFHLFNRPNTDTPLMLHLFVAPSVSVLTGFDCLDFQDVARWRGGGGGGGGGRVGGLSAHNSRALSLSNSFLRA